MLLEACEAVPDLDPIGGTVPGAAEARSISQPATLCLPACNLMSPSLQPYVS